MINELQEKGWIPLASKLDFCKDNWMISLFKNSWHLVFSPEQRIVKESKGELSNYELTQVDTDLFG